jgi:tRNA threonylcarbamoyl adenosine modification protein YjeE
MTGRTAPRTLQLFLADEAATAGLGRRLAPACRAGDVIALRGELGAGKSTLARGLIQALAGAGTEVPSPTFTLVQIYETDRLAIWHFDLYRLARPDDARELGLDESADGLVLIEWPERLGDALPARRLDLALAFSGEARIAYLTDHDAWSDRFDGDWR